MGIEINKGEKEERQDFVLLCGCPRSGTYLLAEHLERAFGIAMPIETHFIPHFERFVGLWVPLDRPNRIRSLRAAIEAYSWLWVYLGVRSRAPDRQAGLSLIPALTGAETHAHSYPGLLHELFARFAEQHGLRRYADKSAPFEPEDLARYDRSLPGMRVIHLIRDGRDVCLSWRKLWFGPRTIAEAAWIWRRHIRTRQAWGRANPDRYFEARYEDFIANPDAMLVRLGAFIRLELSPPGQTAAAKDGALGDLLKYEGTHPKLAGPVDPTNKEKWRREMPVRDVQLFEFVAGSVLRNCGYTTDATRSGFATPAAMWTRYGCGMARRYLSATYYLRRGRELLPFGLWLLQKVGFDVAGRARRGVAGRRRALNPNGSETG